MKKFILVAVVLILSIAGLCVLINSEHDPFARRDIDCEYPGAIVMSRDTFWHCLSLKFKGEIIHTGYYDIQAHYRVGDTINQQCITN